MKSLMPHSLPHQADKGKEYIGVRAISPDRAFR